jgi:hypothetical protein
MKNGEREAYLPGFAETLHKSANARRSSCLHASFLLLALSFSIVVTYDAVKKDSNRCYCWTELLQKEEMVSKKHPLSLLQWRREKLQVLGLN